MCPGILSTGERKRFTRSVNLGKEMESLVEGKRGRLGRQGALDRCRERVLAPYSLTGQFSQARQVCMWREARGRSRPTGSQTQPLHWGSSVAQCGEGRASLASMQWTQSWAPLRITCGPFKGTGPVASPSLARGRAAVGAEDVEPGHHPVLVPVFPGTPSRDAGSRVGLERGSSLCGFLAMGLAEGRPTEELQA